MGTKYFRKRPTVIEANQWTSDTPLVLHMASGDMKTSPGDWIIIGDILGKPEPYFCKRDMFEKTYEPLCMDCKHNVLSNMSDFICDECKQSGLED